MKINCFLYSLLFLALFSYSQTPGNGLTDIDGIHYNSVVINNQEWMQENLNVSHYRNGDEIPQITDLTEWSNATTGAWCYYNDSTFFGTIYGKLYNWLAIKDPRGLAPEGWIIPGEADWDVLSASFGGDNVAGTALKSSNYWTTSTGSGGTNSSGFGARPSGIRAYEGSYNASGHVCYFWTNDNFPNLNHRTRFLIYDSSIFWETPLDYTENNGCAVRCLKNNSLHNDSFITKKINIYPNPAASYINILMENDFSNADYSIYDFTGKKIKSGSLINKHTPIPILDLQKGLYYIILSYNNQQKTVKFCKK